MVAAGGGAVAGALIGTGVGITNGMSMAAATTAAVTTAGTTATAIETANAACGGDMCASEGQDVFSVAEKELPLLENTVQSAQTTINDLLASSQKISSPSGEGIYRATGNASDALNSFGKIVDSQLVNADKGLTRFWGNTSLGGTVQLRLSSSTPSTPVLELFKVPDFLSKIKIHFYGD
jgi:hypothetical protein